MKNLRIQQVRCLLVILLVCLFLSACQETQETYEASGTSGKVVKIGFVGPLTGESSGLGENSLVGVKTALLLQPFLLNGDRPEIVVADDKNDPALTTSAVEKLIREEGVSAILLGSTSKALLSVTDYIDKQKIPAIALLATHPDVSRGDYTTQLPIDDELQGTVAALYVLDEMIIDKATVFVEPEGVHSFFLAEIFVNKFIEAGGHAKRIEYPSDNNELEKILLRLQESGEGFLYLPLHGSSVVEIKRICRKLNYNPEVMLSDGVLSRVILDFDHDLSLVDGMMATDFYSSLVLTKGYGEKLVKIFDSSFDAPKTTYAALGAEGMSILLGAMERCGNSSDTECINGNIHKTNNFLGVNSKISISAEGKVERPIFINKIVNSKLEFEVMVY
ncbi:ABC transporter substrate-binding protein [Desulforhopalus sp. 52FAK]